MIKKCSVCSESASNSMKCNCCSSNFHPSCGNYIRHVWRGGYCPKLECQEAKAARFQPKTKPSKSTLSPLLKQLTPDSPNANSGEPTDSDSQASQKVYRSTRTRQVKKMERTDAPTHTSEHYLRSEDSSEGSSNCHLCNRKVRALNLRECSTCTRVFCGYCSTESERNTLTCKVCKGLCNCKACYTDTFAADMELIMKKPCIELAITQ